MTVLWRRLQAPPLCYSLTSWPSAPTSLAMQVISSQPEIALNGVEPPAISLLSCSGSSPGAPRTTNCTSCCRGTGVRYPPAPPRNHPYDSPPCRLVIVPRVAAVIPPRRLRTTSLRYPTIVLPDGVTLHLGCCVSSQAVWFWHLLERRPMYLIWVG